MHLYHERQAAELVAIRVRDVGPTFCALDLAELDPPASIDEICQVLGVTERVVWRNLESARAKLRKPGAVDGIRAHLEIG